MKISELIEKLQHQKNLWGDISVYHVGEDIIGDYCCDIEKVNPLYREDEENENNDAPYGLNLR
jgi:hypothetical protein